MNAPHPLLRGAAGGLVAAVLALSSAFVPVTAAPANSPATPKTIFPPRITDFNGDGYHDLAVAALNGAAGSVPAAGGVDVMYGSASGLQTSNPAAQYWTANSGGMPEPAQEGAQFGFALSSGDFDGDGYTDLAIGAPRQDVSSDPGTVIDAGALYVVYGSASGLQTSTPAAQYFTADSPGMPSPAVASALLGRSLAAGDFNGDGIDDLAAGAPRQDLSATLTEAGAAYVLYGSASGLQTSAPPAQFWTQDSPGIPDDVEAQDWFARALGTGDFNGDGFGDLAVGVPLEDQEAPPQRRKDPGAINVIHGSAGGLQAGSPAAQFFDQDSHHVRDHDEAGDFFSHNLSSGDFNRDGYADLAIGVRLEDLEGRPTLTDAGGANVLYGSASGLQTDLPQNQFWSQDAHHVHDSAEAGEEFGFGVAAGDFNGDGYDDLAVGVSFESIKGHVHAAGGANVLYGSPAGLQTDFPENQFWTQDSAHVADTAEPVDQFGFSVWANDFNQDGRIDLAIGVVLEDIETDTGPITDAGAINVLYGSIAGLQTDDPVNQFWSEDNPGMPNAAADDDNFGWWLS